MQLANVFGLCQQLQFIYHRAVTRGRVDVLIRSGAEDAHHCAGFLAAFEIRRPRRTFAETKTYHAIICIGCLLRGDTAALRRDVNEVTRGIGAVGTRHRRASRIRRVDCDTLEQAIDRAGLKMGNKVLKRRWRLSRWRT